VCARQPESRLKESGRNRVCNPSVNVRNPWALVSCGTKGNHLALSTRLTYEQAAAILGCHVSNVAKLVAKGQLTSSGRVRDGSLERSEVEALAEHRAQEREARPARPLRTSQCVDPRPDTDHEWLSPRQVAGLLGVTRPAVQKRIHRGTLPATESGGRFWVRRDLLEQVEAARLVRKSRRL